MITFDLKLVDTTDQIVAKMLKAIAGHLRKSIRLAKPDILRRVKEEVGKAITSSPEYNSLMGGKLQAELGVPEPASALKSLLDIWLNEIYITEQPIKVVGDSIIGGIRLEAIRRNLRNVLNSPAASYTTKEGQQIPWLRWLTIMGDSVIIRNYSVDFTNVTNSRTGLAIMVGDKFNSWFVPPEYSGTIDDNFITRALEGVIPTIENIIAEEISQQVKKP